MKHIMFVSPFLWNEKLEALNFEDKYISWLQAIPISETEYHDAQRKGERELEALLGEVEVDILNLNRHSVI